MYGNLTTMILLMLWGLFLHVSGCWWGAEINDWFERRMTGQEQNLLDSKKECG